MDVRSINYFGFSNLRINNKCMCVQKKVIYSLAWNVSGNLIRDAKINAEEDFSFDIVIKLLLAY